MYVYVVHMWPMPWTIIATGHECVASVIALFEVPTSFPGVCRIVSLHITIPHPQVQLFYCLPFGEFLAELSYNIEVVFNQPKMPDPLPSCLKSSIKGPVVIGNDVWIGHSVTIMSGGKVGDGALLGASTVIRKDVPPYAIVIGNPGEIVAYRHTPEQIKKLLDIKMVELGYCWRLQCYTLSHRGWCQYIHW